MRHTRPLSPIALPAGLVALVAALTLTVSATGPQQQQQQQKPQQPTEVQLTITGSPGAPPHYAVPDFLAAPSDAEGAAAGALIARVLWDDLQYERELDLIPRDTYSSIPAARSTTDVPFDRWRELGAEGLVVGAVQRTANGMRVEVRLYQVQTGRVAFSKQYEQSPGPGTNVNVRLFAHTISDDIFEQQRALKGVARTKIAFDSDRAGEVVSTVFLQRIGKEIYVCDYDGEHQARLTFNRSLNISPAWSPDRRLIAFTSWATGNADVFVAATYQTLTVQRPARGSNRVMNSLPAWSPGGERIAFVSDRDGNNEIYVMNADGSNVHRLTNNQAIDSSPAWSPSGADIAFVSDRTGSPQIYVVSADGGQAEAVTRESYCDRPTWSPAPYNEIAYTSRTAPNVFDIRIIDMATRKIRQVTFGERHNESPAYSPNGRHIAFTSNRSGRFQVYTVHRLGGDLRQLTTAGNNYMPNWR